MDYAVGSLVRARQREWIVLPESEGDLLVLRPLGGTDDETTGIYLPLEKVEHAQFNLPTANQIGDYQSCKLLRESLRIGFRSSAGPLRSFGRIAVEPRPYQLVPLMMAMKLDPVRMLIADDVGIGKTIESCLIAREMVDRSECSRLCVLCPPHLAQQWQKELHNKFHIDAELVLSSTVRRLEKQCRQNQSIFEVFPFTVVSIDYIKTDRRREDFLRAAPELVIVDEAHTASFDATTSSSRHQRHRLIKDLSQNTDRHMILVTATPHSGKEAAFRSLLGLLNPDFLDYPEDMSGKQNEQFRRDIAAHFIQRRRKDIEHFEEDTEFATCEAKEESYTLSEPYKALFDKALRYTREIVTDNSDSKRHQRVRWWSALALLRALASSPAAAAATLRSRSASLDTDTEGEADEIGRRQVLDLDDSDSIDASDTLPGAVWSEQPDSSPGRRLREMAKEADQLRGDQDQKMMTLLTHLKKLLKDGFRPIVFCRFIQTAEYLAEELRARLPKKLEIAAITGLLPPDERQRRVEELAEHPDRILVATDCLSEGINLQEHFDAIIHYDLSWNPTRHEQREGRVDRFGQPSRQVRMLTYFGRDNQIDGIVLDVLLRKHQKIRSSLGVSVPVPGDTSAVVEAVFEGILLRGQTSRAGQHPLLPGMDEFIAEQQAELHREWDNVSEKEKRSRTMFAQDALTSHVEEVRRELAAIRSSIGSPADVENFVRSSLRGYGATFGGSDDVVEINLTQCPVAVREACGHIKEVKARFRLPVESGVEPLSRTHPLVEGLANFVLTTALDENIDDAVARRCGVIRSRQIERRTTLLLLRHRFHLTTYRSEAESFNLAEDVQTVAFNGSPENAQWLPHETVEPLIETRPTANITPDQALGFIQKVLDGFPSLLPQLETFAREKAEQLRESHVRIREASRMRSPRRVEVRPELPPDVLGIFVYLPDAK